MSGEERQNRLADRAKALARMVHSQLGDRLALEVGTAVLERPGRFAVLFNARLAGRALGEREFALEVLEIARAVRRGGDA